MMGQKGFSLTCLLHKEQNRKDPHQRPAPTQGTHAEAGTSADGGEEGVGHLTHSPGGPGAYVAGGLGPVPSSWATQTHPVLCASHVCLLSGRG